MPDQTLADYATDSTPLPVYRAQANVPTLADWAAAGASPPSADDQPAQPGGWLSHLFSYLFTPETPPRQEPTIGPDPRHGSWAPEWLRQAAEQWQPEYWQSATTQPLARLIGAAQDVTGKVLGTRAGQLANLASVLAPFGRSLSDRLILSTRVPYGKNLAAFAEGQPLVTGVAEAAQDPALLAKFANDARKTPLIKPHESLWSDRDVVDLFTNRAAENIDTLIDLLPPELQRRAAQWYQGAHGLALDIAEEHGLSSDQGAALLASQSPSKEWPQNIELAKRLARDWRRYGESDPVYDQATWEQYRKTTEAAVEREPWKAAKKRAEIADAAQHIGTNWSDLPPTQRAQYIRAQSELTEPQTFPIYNPEGQIVDPVATIQSGKNQGKVRTLQWQTYPILENGLSILNDDSPENISQALGMGHKVRSFFNNISDPFDPRSVTVDTHNVAGAHFRPLGGTNPEVEAVFSKGAGSAATGIIGAHPLYRDAVTQAAEARGLVPSQAQSISWEGLKGLFSTAQKQNAAIHAAVNDIWRAYEQGRIPLQEAQFRIHDLAGGYTPPEWATPPALVGAR